MLCLFKSARARGRPRRTLPRSRARKGYPAAPRSCAWRSSALVLSMMSIVCLTTVITASLVSDSHTTRKLLSKPRFCRCVRKKKTTGKSCGTFPHRNFHGNVFDFHTEIFGPRAPRCSIRVLWATERIKDLVFEEQPFSGGQCNCGRRAVSVRAVTSSIGTRSR